MVMDSKLQHPLNVLLAITVIEFGRTIETIFVHMKKAHSPMQLTEFGMTINVKPTHQPKALLPISVIWPGMARVGAMSSQPLKALSLMRNIVKWDTILFIVPFQL